MRYLYLNKGLIMKKICIFLFFCLSLANAALTNSIVLIVEKEPITAYDISQTMKVLNISREEALNLLINEKIEASQMKQLEIVVNDLEVDEGIRKIMAQGGMNNLEQFRANLKARGQSYESFRANFKRDLEKRKLYEKIANSSKTDFSEEGAKKFFEQNKNKFAFFANINVNVYSSSDPSVLESLRNTKQTKLKAHNVTLNLSNADPRLLGLLSQIKIGDFSPVLNSRDGYELYEVKSKSNQQNVEYEQIKNEVLNAYINEQRQNSIQDYFEKLRSKASIEYLDH